METETKDRQDAAASDTKRIVSPPKVLVACEFSGIVREAFAAEGCDAYSCDYEDTEIPGQHFKGNVVHKLYNEWDLIIAHPPCTRIANSGVRWLHERDLWQELEAACSFFNQFQRYHEREGVPVVIENPIPHKYAVEKIGKYDQLIQPWQFGHGETKATCLWIYGLPELKPTNVVDGREHRVHEMPPGKDRKKERSRTYPGIAKAMAEQWAPILFEKAG